MLQRTSVPLVSQAGAQHGVASHFNVCEAVKQGVLTAHFMIQKMEIK